MKFECNRSEFLEVLINVSRAAAPKSALAVIEGIFMKATSSGLYLCCYNLDMGIARHVPAHITNTGAAVMPMRFIEMIKKLPGERVVIDCNEKYVVHIESDFSEFDIIAMPSDDFPELPIVEGDYSIEVSESKLRSMITQTTHALSTRPDRPVYTGALFKAGEGILKIVTVDGYRVAVRTEEVGCTARFDFIVPGKTLTDISRMLGDVEDLVEINVAKHNIVFLINGYSVVSRLMSGQFNDYLTLFNTSSSYVFTVKTSDILAGVERMALVISESHRNPVKCVFGGKRIKFSCETPVGRAETELPCSCPEFGKDMLIGFNNRYMVDAFKAVDTDSVRILISGEKLPVIVMPPEGSHFQFLLLPLLLNASEEDDKAKKGPKAEIDVEGSGPRDDEEDPEAYFADEDHED